MSLLAHASVGAGRRPRPATRAARRLAAAAAVVLGLTGLLPGVATAVPLAPAAMPAAAPAATTSLHLRVESARTWNPAGLHEGDPIPHYQWLITKDDTGDTSHYGTTLPVGVGNSSFDCTPQSLGGDPAYPAHCQWPSIRSIPGGTTAQVVAQGDESTLSQATALTNLPDGKYMISVTADGFDVPGCTKTPTVTCHVDGFKVDGTWFSVPDPGTGLVTVKLQPYPLPLATIRARVWNDLQTNGAYDTGEPTLAGFTAKLTDIGGQIQSDWFGNPLCTTYQHDSGGLMLFGTDGKPLVATLGGKCVSDANGDIVIPYMPPQRYSVEVIPPNGQTWHQTTTLEGWHDWDTWAIQGWNGFDPEFIQGGEPFPFAEFGFVQTQACGSPAANPSAGQPTACSGPSDPTVPLSGTSADAGSIKGTVLDTTAVSPAVGGVPIGGAQGNVILGPMNKPLVSLIDTNLNDTTVYVGQGNADGTFQINHVPDGDYVLSYWDEDQAYLLTEVNVSVRNGQVADLGNLDAAAWWGEIHGKVCFDANRNGKCDPGEAGIPGLTLNLLGRDNSLQPSGDNAAVTDANGNYDFPRAYPLGQFVVEQGYWEQFYTVGVTSQGITDPSETTQMANGGFVDISTLNAIGLDSRVDWAIHTYETDPSLGPTTGGIVGEMVYNTTQINTDGRFQISEPNEPGIPGFTVHVYWPVKCDPTSGNPLDASEPFTAHTGGTTCTPETTAFGTSNYLVNTDDGSMVRGPEAAAPYTSETWQRPVDCVARDASGTPMVEQVLPPPTGGHDCLEAPLMGSQVSRNADTGIGMTVNGNYGFTQITTDVHGTALASPATIPAGDWIVAPDSPRDVNGAKIWRPSLEEDVNGYTGDELVAPGETPVNPPTPTQPPAAPIPAPAIPPFLCVGAMHTVNVVATRAAALFNLDNPTTTSGIYNPDFLGAGGGSPFQNTQKPLCDTKLVTVRNGRSATPNFYWRPQADVPLPSRIFGLVVDDLNLSTNPKELFFGEKYGIPNLPVGIYDFSDRLVKTVNTDPNGMFEVELPSTTISDCPSPASLCPGMYRYLANDPGQPGHPNANYNPAYRTIGAFFESWPGISGPADLAPTPSALTIELPGTTTRQAISCSVNDPTGSAPLTPELFAIDKPYMASSATGTARTFTLTGQGFGAAQGSGLVSLDGRAMTINSWSDRQISFSVPSTGANSPAPGPHQLAITGNDGRSATNGLTFHVLGTGYNPTVLEVGPGKTYDPTAAAHNTGGYEHAIQDALDAAAGSAQALVVVYPGPTDTFNPLGGYFENVIMHSPVKLQGVGPGGVYADSTQVPGTVLDGLGFGTDGARDTGWAAVIAGLPAVQSPTTAAIPEGEVILAVATSATQYTSGYRAAIDGLTVQNGDVMDFNANFNNVGNGPAAFNEGGQTPTNPSQGGGIVAFDATRYLQITNNVIRSNTGAYGGAIRLGTPDGRQQRPRGHPHRPQPDHQQRRQQPRRGRRDLRRDHRLRGQQQRRLRQLLRRVRRWHQPLRPQRRRQHPRQPGLLQRLLRRGRRHPDRRRAPADADRPVRRLGRRRRLQQPDPGQPGQRRRRRPALPDRRQLPVQRLQQHHREQHLHARGRWRGDRQRAQRAVLQQHGHEEPDHGHGRHQQRPGGAGRPLHGSQQRLPAGHAARRARRCSATPPSSTTSSGTTGPGPGIRPPAWSAGSAAPTSPGSWIRRPSTTGTWASPARATSCPRQTRSCSRSRRPTTTSSRAPPRTRSTRTPASSPPSTPRSWPCRGAATRTSWPTSSSPRTCPSRSWATTISPGRHHRRRTRAPRPRPCRATSSRLRPGRRRPSTSTATAGPAASATRRAPTSFTSTPPTSASPRRTA